MAQQCRTCSTYTVRLQQWCAHSRLRQGTAPTFPALTCPDVAPEVLAAAYVQLAGHMASLSGWQLQDQTACTAKHCSRVHVVCHGTDKQLLMHVKACL